MVECAAHNGNVGSSILSKLTNNFYVNTIFKMGGVYFSGKINALHALASGSIPDISTFKL